MRGYYRPDEFHTVPADAEPEKFWNYDQAREYLRENGGGLLRFYRGDSVCATTRIRPAHPDTPDPEAPELVWAGGTA